MTNLKTEHERLARAYLRVFNERRLDLFEEIASPDFVSHLRVGDLRGIARFKAMMVDFFEAFPDVRWIVDEWVFAEERVVVRYHWEGTQRAAWLGIPASHKPVRGEGLELIHFAGGRITEIWNYSDIMGLAAQLHAPAPLELSL